MSKEVAGEERPSDSGDSRKPSVMMVTRSGMMGGVEEHVFQLSQYLISQGFEVLWLVLSGSKISQKYSASPEIRFITLDDSPGQSISSFLLLRRLFRLVWKHRPCVVHLHGIRPMFLFSLIPFPKGVRRISTVHGSYLLMAMTSDGKIISWKRLLSLLFHLFSCWRSHKVLTVSSAIYQELQRLPFVLKLRNMHVVYNGVNCNRSKTRKILPQEIQKTIRQDEVQIVFLGRLDPKKGIKDILRAAALIDSSLPVRYHLIGGGYLRSQYESLSLEFGLRDRVHFWGNIDGAGEMLTAFDVFVLPSYSEGMPLTVLEAMEAGIPVIATDVGGIPEAVVNGETGYLFSPGDVDAFAGSIELLATEKDLCHKLGSCGVKRVDAHFNQMVQFSKILNCYVIGSN